MLAAQKKLNRKAYLDILNLERVAMCCKFIAGKGSIVDMSSRRKAAIIVTSFIRRKLTLIKFQQHVVKVLEAVRKFGKKIII
jgi:hypothetical protein